MTKQIYSFKPFFTHIKRGPGKLPNRQPRGATVYVQPDLQTPGNVLVHTVWCSPKDEFNKRLGRERSINTFPISVPARRLPEHLSQTEKSIFPEHFAMEQDFYYLYKRML